MRAAAGFFRGSPVRADGSRASPDKQKMETGLGSRAASADAKLLRQDENAQSRSI